MIPSPRDRAAELLRDALVRELRMSNKAATAFVDRELPHVLSTASQPAPQRVLAPGEDCTHPEFHVPVGVARVGEGDAGNPRPGMPTAFVVELSVKCEVCGEAFKFNGVPAGLSYDAPATSVDGRELRAPVWPVSLPPRRQYMPPGSLSGFRIDVHVQDDPPPVNL